MGEAEVKEILLGFVDRNGWWVERERNSRLENAKEVAKEMLLDGEPIEKIVKYTRLSIEDIQNLQHQTANAN